MNEPKIPIRRSITKDQFLGYLGDAWDRADVDGTPLTVYSERRGADTVLLNSADRRLTDVPNSSTLFEICFGDKTSLLESYE